MNKQLKISLIFNLIFLILAVVYTVEKVRFYSKHKINPFKNAPVTYKVPDLRDVRAADFTWFPNLPNSIIFCGDSHIDRFELSELFQNANILNRGIDGDGCYRLLKRLPEITNRNPTKLFILIGENDLLVLSHPVDTLIKNTIEILIKVHTVSPKTKVYLHSLIPSSLSKKNGKPVIADEIIYNSKMAEYCKSHQITFIDIFTKLRKNKGLDPLYDSGDHVHLSGNGYLLWRDLLKPYIQ